MESLLQRLETLTDSLDNGMIAWRSVPNVLYCVSHAYPYSSNGYAVRTHGVAKAIFDSGLNIVVASRPGFPWDVPGTNVDCLELIHSIDGVKYIATREPSKDKGSINHYLHLCVDAAKELIRVYQPSVVMAGSNWHNALPVSIAAKELGVPFYYEVRGFWEISYIAKEPSWKDSAGYRLEVNGETIVAESAQGVFTLNRFMKGELVRRGIKEELIQLVPNGFSRVPKSPPFVNMRDSLGVKSKYVVGYVGSFSIYEGLEDLIKAVALLRKQGIDVSLLLVGSGQPVGMSSRKADLCEMSVKYFDVAKYFGIEEYVFMPGRVEPQDASSYYDAIDVVVIPRKPYEVCELVTPMKPLEAAAHGKHVLMSDVGPLADLMKLGQCFSVFEKGNVNSLVDNLADLLNDEKLASCDNQFLDQFEWCENVKPMVTEFKRFARNQ